MSNYNRWLSDRANTTTKWMFEDEKIQYHQLLKEGILSKIDDHDISYTFNSDGYRCDNFTDESELPIVFLGCSMTEGMGMKFEHLWTSRILSIIRELTGKKIPHWSLAVAGGGFDDQVRRLYELSQRIPIKHVYGLFPSITRREYKYNNSDYRLWVGGQNDCEHINQICVDQHFAEYQLYRSLMILNSLRQALDFKITISPWVQFPEAPEIYKNFPNIKYLKPLNGRFDCARDQCHYGPKYHLEMSKYMWENSKENYD
jgi:hypothetical protein